MTTENTIKEISSEAEKENDFNITSIDLSALAATMQQRNEEKSIGLTEEAEEVPDLPVDYEPVKRKDIVTTIAYLIGIRSELLDRYFRSECEELLQKLEQDTNATVIRYLSILRTQIMSKFKEVDQAIRFYMKPIDQMDFYNEVDFDYLKENGVSVFWANTEAIGYLVEITKLINDRIMSAKQLFPDWINWEYLKDMFVVKNPEKSGRMRSEQARFVSNRRFYPYSCYINWTPKEDDGNILWNDGRFLKILYAHHRDSFNDRSKYVDASEGTRNGIYDFIDKAKKVVMVVDCENSDLFKLYSVLHGLDEGKLSKIEKIVLYDDEHTTEAWDWLGQLTKLQVEHIEVERIVDRKSLVDIEIAVGVCKSYYEEHVDSVILLSSDSDYWGLISSLPQVNFLVMYEREKCGRAIKEALTEHEIFYCCMDDFCSWDVPQVQRIILFRALERELPYIIGRNPMEVTEEIYEKTRIQATEEERIRFCSKYVKTLKLQQNKEGKLWLEIQK